MMFSLTAMRLVGFGCVILVLGACATADRVPASAREYSAGSGSSLARDCAGASIGLVKLGMLGLPLSLEISGVCLSGSRAGEALAPVSAPASSAVEVARAAEVRPLSDTGRSPRPSPGDTWTYRLTEPRRGNPIARAHRVTVESVSAEGVYERAAHAPHRNGSYLVSEGEMVLFSPYLASFDPQLTAVSVNGAVAQDLLSCGGGWLCTVSARVVGEEIVRVPAGEFVAVKVEVDQAWTARSQSAAPAGARILTIWYSPQAKRAVKFSSRGTYAAHFKTEFDLELEEFQLN